MSARHRKSRVRPRYGRIALAVSALVVTLTAVTGGIGLLARHRGSPAAQSLVARDAASTPSASGADRFSSSASPRRRTTSSPPARSATPKRAASRASDAATVDEAPLPPDSGTGRRAVFSQGLQRVWLVGEEDQVERTYLVSGSAYDNLDPGTYAVYSRSEDAWGVDGSSMHWFVRFTKGASAAIGFHTIPELGGSPVQTLTQLGTPLSHGCIRQDLPDALAMWAFAQLGTTVVVTP